MGTITGQVLAASRRAVLVPLPDAEPGHVPGWYTLHRGYRATPLLIGEAPDLAGRIKQYRRYFQTAGDVLPGDASVIYVGWVEAESLLGPKAWLPHYRESIASVLISILQPEWHGMDFVLGDGVAVSLDVATPVIP
jgi:hypothetical protein